MKRIQLIIVVIGLLVVLFGLSQSSLLAGALLPTCSECQSTETCGETDPESICLITCPGSGHCAGHECTPGESTTSFCIGFIGCWPC
jgi:hypothetical protein